MPKYFSGGAVRERASTREDCRLGSLVSRSRRSRQSSSEAPSIVWCGGSLRRILVADRDQCPDARDDADPQKGDDSDPEEDDEWWHGSLNDVWYQITSLRAPESPTGRPCSRWSVPDTSTLLGRNGDRRPTGDVDSVAGRRRDGAPALDGVGDEVREQRPLVSGEQHLGVGEHRVAVAAAGDEVVTVALGATTDSDASVRGRKKCESEEDRRASD